MSSAARRMQKRIMKTKGVKPIPNMIRTPGLKLKPHPTNPTRMPMLPGQTRFVNGVPEYGDR